jgi:Transcriptional Coactivator p15 (PC4)
VRVCLTTFEGHDLIEIRTWFTADGKLTPGKGFAAEVKHLPRLATEIGKALTKARELGLLSEEAGHE